MIRKQLDGSPADAVLTFLQRKGTATVKELEAGLGVTATAVRQQLVSLMAKGYIQQKIERVGRGRPRHIYSLTPKIQALFPHNYDEFTNCLLNEILTSDGVEKAQSLMQRLGQRLAKRYTQQITGEAPAERAAQLVALFNAKGILAEMEVQPNAITVNLYTCPYYKLARQHRIICEMGQNVMSQVIERPVELLACTLDGHHGCQFKFDTAQQVPG